MANRSLRRPNIGATITPLIAPEPTREYVHSTILESGAEQTPDTSAIGNDNEPVTISDKPKRIGVVEIDPSDLDATIRDRTGSSDSDGKRTRKPRSDAGTTRSGSGRKKRKEAPQNVEALVTMVHTWAAVILKTPELMLDESEVKKLNAAYEAFSEHHEVPILNPKRMSEIMLIGTLGMVYGTRMVAIGKRKKTAKNAAKLRVMQGGQQQTN